MRAKAAAAEAQDAANTVQEAKDYVFNKALPQGSSYDILGQDSKALDSSLSSLDLDVVKKGIREETLETPSKPPPITEFEIQADLGGIP